MRILMVVKYPPIQGGVSIQNYWLAQVFAELGHEICVLTNAEEVEDEYRIHLTEEDRALLTGYRKKNSIRVISTYTNAQEVFIPQSRPFLTKLVSLGLEIIEEFKPHFIYAHYIEPYGIAALQLSLLTDVPYVVKHAGSDLGKLGKLPEMKTLHERVYQHAEMVVTHQRHHFYFKNIGIDDSSLRVLGLFPWAPDVFYGEPLNTDSSALNLLVYGKTGPSKGTEELIQALANLYNEGFPCHLTAHWGGREFVKYQKQAERNDLHRKGILQLNPYVPHWKIARQIRKSDAVLFLENQFRISIHTPGIPFEVLSCNRLLVTTEEIAKKYPNLLNEENSVVIPEKKVSVEGVVSAIKKAEVIKAKYRGSKIDGSLLYSQGVSNVQSFLDAVSLRVS